MTMIIRSESVWTVFRRKLLPKVRQKRAMSLYLIPSSKYAQWTPLTAITDSFQDWSALMPQKKISKNSVRKI